MLLLFVEIYKRGL